MGLPMGFGTPFAQKPRRAERVRPLTGTLVRIVVLAMFAVGGAAWGIYVYYTHAFRVKTRPAVTSTASASNEVEIDLSPSTSSSR